MSRRLRLGMVGGGENAFIGAVHRMAARLDGHWDLVAGAFQSNADKSIAFGRGLGLAADRCYGDFGAMASAEAKRPDRIDAVAIVTPNASHHAIARTFLDAGVAVICDKPLTTNLTDARDLAAVVRSTGAPFILSHNYSGYPAVRQVRSMTSDGVLGDVRVVFAEYLQGWLAADLGDQKQAAWRSDPSQAGPGGALGDIATHAFHLVEFMTGLKASSLAADLASFVPGRRLDDNANILLRFDNGAKGQLCASQVAVGVANGLRVRIYGDKGGVEWAQEEPDMLRYAPLGEAPRILRRGGPGFGQSAQHATRIPSGHPEGYLEGFAQIYTDAAELIRAHAEGRRPNPQALLTPGIADGVRGVAFIEAAVRSNKQNSAWTALETGETP